MSQDWLEQIPQLVGAMMILAAYALSQLQILNPKSLPYLLMNCVGAAILAWIAFDQKNWGFVLLEGTWSAISLWSLLTRERAQNG